MYDVPGGIFGREGERRVAWSAEPVHSGQRLCRLLPTRCNAMIRVEGGKEGRQGAARVRLGCELTMRSEQ
jgi:hypothetical protein